MCFCTPFAIHCDNHPAGFTWEEEIIRLLARKLFIPLPRLSLTELISHHLLFLEPPMATESDWAPYWSRREEEASRLHHQRFTSQGVMEGGTEGARSAASIDAGLIWWRTKNLQKQTLNGDVQLLKSVKKGEMDLVLLPLATTSLAANTQMHQQRLLLSWWWCDPYNYKRPF